MNARYSLATLCLLIITSAGAQSVITQRLDDPQAVYLDAGFHAKGDGRADDSDALQAAIDRVVDLHGEGIVFVPAGRYRLTRTVFVWAGVRLIGYGAERPTFVLAPGTPGYESRIAYMLFFAGDRPDHAEGVDPTLPARFHRPPTPPGTVPQREDVPDANPGTFYSALTNVNFQIGAGNAGAVAVRFHAAQHSTLSHIDFDIGSGFAGIHEVGNEAEDLHFHGGQFGIMARKPSPAWQFTLLDSSFDGQRETAIRENEAGLTLVNVRFRDVPTAVSIDAGFSDQLWIKNSSFEHVSGPAIMVSNEASRMTEINVEDAFCRDVPVFAQLRESGKQFRGQGPEYTVSTFTHGLMLSKAGTSSNIGSTFSEHPSKNWLTPRPDAVPSTPPSSEWINVHKLGVLGDNRTDDTAALQRAVDTHRVLYFPSGRYRLTDTLRLRPDSVLIGLHPSAAQFDLPEGTPAFQGPGAPKALLLAPTGGNAQVRGLGISTGGLNGRAVGLLWRSGPKSVVDDVRFLGGHGTNEPDGRRRNPYNNTHSADPDLHRPWNSQYPSLWVDAGGGTFANIWTPDTYAQAGMLVSNTEVPGFIYEVSSEHHVHAEFQFQHVSHWQLFALQTEEESGESQFASSLEIDDSHDLTIANYHGYRVTHSEQPFPYAVRVSRSKGIHFRNFHVDSNSSIAVCDEAGVCRQGVRPNKVPFADAIVDDTGHLHVRDREFASFDINENASAFPVPTNTPKLKQLATGFFNASGGAVDAAGKLYFVDARFRRIYRWSPQAASVEVVRDAPLEPVNLVFDRSGDLLVISSAGRELTAYSFRPDEPQSPDADLKVLKLQPMAEHPGMSVAMPVDYWFNGDFANTLSAAPPYTYTSLQQMFTAGLGTVATHAFVAPDNSLFLPTNLPIVQGEPFFGTKWVPALYAYGLVKGSPGSTFYATNEAEQRTYRGTLRADGSLANLQPFLERGGESLAVDKRGNIYIAAGQIYVYSSSGKLLHTIACPERPHDIVFGGKDGETLYVLSEHSLSSIGAYATRPPK